MSTDSSMPTDISFSDMLKMSKADVIAIAVFGGLSLLMLISYGVIMIVLYYWVKPSESHDKQGDSEAAKAATM